MPNIILEFLPPYSPDYNLMELVWHSAKEYIANKLFGVADLQYESLKMQLLKHWLRLVSRCMQNSISYPD
jgi:transposase